MSKVSTKERGHYIMSQIVGSKEFNKQVPILDTSIGVWGRRKSIGGIIAEIYEKNPTRWECKSCKNKQPLQASTITTYFTSAFKEDDLFLHKLIQIQEQYYQNNQVSDNESSDKSSDNERQLAKSKIDTKKYFSLEQYTEMNRLRKEYGDPELGLLSCKSVEEALDKVNKILKYHKRNEEAYRIVCEDLAGGRLLSRQSLDELKDVHKKYKTVLAEKTQWHTKAMVEVQYYYDNFANCPDLSPFKEAVEKAHSVGKLCELTNEVGLYNFCINHDITIEDVNKYLQVNRDGESVFNCSLEEFITIKDFVR